MDRNNKEYSLLRPKTKLLIEIDPILFYLNNFYFIKKYILLQRASHLYVAQREYINIIKARLGTFI